MTVALWPSDLPQRVLVPDFEFTLSDSRLFTEMDSGLDKSRVRGVAAEEVSCSINLDANGYARFKRFCREQIGKLVLPFLIRDQIFDGLVIDGFDNEVGEPTTGTYYWLSIFGKVKPPLRARGGSWYQLSFTLLIMPD